MASYYELLHINPDASRDDIRRAFYRLAKRYHPDISKNSSSFLKILNAYETLIDDAKRRSYDRMNETASYSRRVVLSPERVSYAVSLQDIAKVRFFSPARRGRGSRVFPNLKGYDVCVDITPSELASGAVVCIDVPAHVICPLCRGNHTCCSLCSDRGYVLRAVGVPVVIPEGVSHDDVFAVPLRKIKYKEFAFTMMKQLWVKVKVIQGEENECSKHRS